MNRVFLSLLFMVAVLPVLPAADPEEEPKLTLSQAKAKFDKADRELNAARLPPTGERCSRL